MANLNHAALTANSDLIHIPYEWTYADETAREAASGMVAGDVGKFCRQLDDNTIWMLTDDDPVTWIAVGGSAGGGGLYEAYICIQDQKNQNTNGGTFTLGAWRTRVLNTEVADTGNLASVASNQITLAAGTYRCLISCPAFRGVGNHQARLYNTTGSATLSTGTSEYVFTNVAAYACTRSIIAGQFTIAVQSVLEVQHISVATFADTGFGVPCNATTEVYTIAEFWKEA